MKLGEKLQQLRKQSGLSQEQLAAQLTVSRQAVSKWELDETMPDTENVIQLSRLFGVSCDYLLRDEVDEQGEALPVLGKTHLDEKGWTHNATALSLGVCAIGFLVALIGLFHHLSTIGLFVGLIIQVAGLVLFELAAPRMGERRGTARLRFYMAANWLLVPIPMVFLCWYCLSFFIRQPYPSILLWAVFLSCDLMFSAAVTAVLGWLRGRQTHKS